MLTDAEYQTYVTGYPEGIVYAMQNPDTGDTCDFAAFVDGHLVHTVGSLHGAVRPDGSLPEQTARSYLGLASVQLKAAAGVPIRWVCQHPEDADALRALLADVGPELRGVVPFGAMVVVAVPPAPEPPAVR